MYVMVHLIIIITIIKYKHIMRKIFVKLYKRFCFCLSCLWRILLGLLINAVFLFLCDSPSFYRDEYAREELKKECSLVQGVVYDVHTGRGDHYINYSFSIKGKEYKGVSRYGAWEHKYGREPEEGDSVSICYKQNNPEINMLLEYFDAQPNFKHKWSMILYPKIRKFINLDFLMYD